MISRSEPSPPAFCAPILFFLFLRKERIAAPGEERKENSETGSANRAAIASEEASSIPFPPGRRKLHIRSLLLPSQTGTISLGSGLADKWGLSGHRPDWGSFFEPILFFLLQKEKNGFNLPRKERGPVPTVVLNLTQKISAIIRPLRQSLPSERSLRSAHRLSAEPRSKTNTCGPMSTRKGQAASVTLLRREQLRSASAPTNTSEVQQKIEEAGGQGRPPLQEVRCKPGGAGR